MSLVKHLEMSCDNCGCAEHFTECSKPEAERQAKNYGWIIYRGHHFDTEHCRDAWKTRNPSND